MECRGEPLEYPTRNTPSTTIAVVFFGVAFLVAFIVVHSSRLLRPIADDYAFGVAAQYGIVGGVIDWWMSWSGAITSMALVTLVVGLPVLHLPWGLASATAFVSAVAVLVGWSIWVLGPKGQTRGERLFTRVSMAPVFILAWFGYWWVPALPLKGPSLAKSLAQSVTHWQTVVVQYVLVTSLLTWIWVNWETRVEQKPTMTKRALQYALMGMVTGFAGPVFAAAACVMAAILAAVQKLNQTTHSNASIVRLIAGAFGIVLGAAISHNSPGSQYRSTYFATQHIDLPFFYRVFTNAVPRSAYDVVSAVFHPGSFAAILTVFVGTVLMAGWTTLRSANQLAAIGVSLIVFSWILFLVMRVSQYFAYSAFWHETSPRTVVWMGMVSLAMSGGTMTKRIPGRPFAGHAIALGGFVGVVLCTAGVFLMTDDIRSRSTLWEAGPAPLDGIADIEEVDGWVLPLWRELSLLRDVPARTFSFGG